MLENLSFQFEFSLKTFYTSVIAVLTVLTLNKAILPAYRSFKNQIKLSKISNTKTGHWLYGHLKEVNIFKQLINKIIIFFYYSRPILFQIFPSVQYKRKCHARNHTGREKVSGSV